jgi:uncharacterized protein (DUF58 family)
MTPTLVLLIIFGPLAIALMLLAGVALGAMITYRVQHNQSPLPALRRAKVEVFEDEEASKADQPGQQRKRL